MRIDPHHSCDECCESHACMEFIVPGYEYNESIYICQKCLDKAVKALQQWKDAGRRDIGRDIP